MFNLAHVSPGTTFLRLTSKILKYLKEGRRTCEKLTQQLQEPRVIYSKQ